MTEKEWKIIDEEFISYTGGTAQLISNGECKVHLWETPKDAQLFCDKLNEQHETIQEKQDTINEMAKAIRIYDDGYIGLNKENQRLLKANMKLTEENTAILNTIRTAYQNERTSIGRNTLKQLLDNIEQL